MKKTTKAILSLSLFCIILGGAAALFGSLNGGIEAIQKATQPQKVDKNITSFKELNLDLPMRHLTIEPSKDNNWHLSYYTDDKILGKVQEGKKRRHSISNKTHKDLSLQVLLLHSAIT